MNVSKTFWTLFSALALLTASMGTAGAATVIYSNITDASSGSLFSATNTTVAGDTLNIGFGSFSATAADFPPGKTDTISFTVAALGTNVIKSIAYNEQGTYSGSGFVLNTGNFTVNGVSQTGLNFFQPSGATGSPWTLSFTQNFAGITSLAVVISDTLVAGGSTASILKNLASFSVTTQDTAVPVPAAVWMLGSALIGLGFIGRRRAE